MSSPTGNLNPDHGSSGSFVDIKGKGLAQVEHVHFGSKLAISETKSDALVSATAPENSSRVVDVTVTDNTGSYNVGRFTYD